MTTKPDPGVIPPPPGFAALGDTLNDDALAFVDMAEKGLTRFVAAQRAHPLPYALPGPWDSAVDGWLTWLSAAGTGKSARYRKCWGTARSRPLSAIPPSPSVTCVRRPRPRRARFDEIRAAAALRVGIRSPLNRG